MYLKRCEVVSRPEYLKVDIQETVKKYSTIKKWAYILHDKDDTAPHYHIYLNFDRSSVESKTIADWFGLQESQVSKVHGKKESDMLLYLIHGNDTQKNKHQYDFSEVVSNFDYRAEVESSKIIGNFREYSYAQMIRYVDSLPVSEKIAVNRQLENLWKFECRRMSLETDRTIDVVFICGKGGVGKTFYAKRMLSELNYDFCLSSSSNDPFQDYLGQKAIILDDLRCTSFSFEDLLKILDNNNSSTVQSRFVNKVFNGKMIVITSAVPLRYWYKTGATVNGRSLNQEDFNQFYRRIGCYVEIDTAVIKVFTDIDKSGNPCGDYSEYVNDLIQDKILEDSKKEKTDFRGIFDKFCKVFDDNGF